MIWDAARGHPAARGGTAGARVSLALSLSHTHTHARARTHARTHTHKVRYLLSARAFLCDARVRRTRR